MFLKSWIEMGGFELNHQWHGINMLSVFECALVALLVCSAGCLTSAFIRKSRRLTVLSFVGALSFATAAYAANTALSALSASGALAGANLIYVVQTAGTGGVKATMTQVATFINSLFSGDATVTSGGVVTVTKTNGTSFGALATVAPGTGVATAAANALNATGGLVGFGGNIGTASGNITGNAATVTTNANLTGDVASVGNATTYNNVVPRAKGGTQTTTGAFLKITYQKFTAATAGTNYVAPTGLLYAEVEIVGGGGGGGAAVGTVNDFFGGGGGGSGGFTRCIFTAAAISGQTIVIPAAASGGAAGTNNGSSGGDVTLGTTLCVGKGGTGGMYGSAGQVGLGGAGGVLGTGDFTNAGNPGGYGIYSNTTGLQTTSGPGFGASSFFGGGAPAGGNGAGTNASSCGGGGAGALENFTANAAGGNGFQGCVFVREFLNQ